MTLSRERLTTAAILAGLTAAFVAAVYLPGRKADVALRAETAAAEAAAARGPLVLEQLRSARQELVRQQAYLARTDGAIPPTADPHVVLASVSRLARTNGLAVVRLAPEPPRPHASYVEHPFRLEFRGPADALAGFLGGLEESPRLYAVAELDLRPQEAEADRGDLEGSVRFAAFSASGGSASSAESDASPTAARSISMTRR